MNDILQQIINGLAVGSMYALLALGYTMVYGVLRLINFAHGDVFMVGAFAACYSSRIFQRAMGLDDYADQTLWVALFGLVASMLTCGALGYVIERFCYRPLRKSSRLYLLITAIGISLFLEYLLQVELHINLAKHWPMMLAFLGCIAVVILVGRIPLMRKSPRVAIPLQIVGVVFVLYKFSPLYFDKDVEALRYFGTTPTPFPQITQWGYHFADSIPFFQNKFHLSISGNDLLTFGATAVCLAILLWIVQKTRTGQAMRAVSVNYDAAQLMGIDINRIISISFILGSTLAAVGGVIYGLRYRTVDPLIGVLFGLKAFIAAVIGGIGNIRGAAAGGLLLGLLEAGIAYFGGSQYQDVAAFVVLILVLLIKPEGILGKALPEKV